MLYMKGFKIIINEAEVVLAAIPDGILNFILALDNSGVLLFVGGIDPATESHVYWYYDRCLNVNDNLTLQIEDLISVLLLYISNQEVKLRLWQNTIHLKNNLVNKD